MRDRKGLVKQQNWALYKTSGTWFTNFGKGAARQFRRAVLWLIQFLFACLCRVSVRFCKLSLLQTGQLST